MFRGFGKRTASMDAGTLQKSIEKENRLDGNALFPDAQLSVGALDAPRGRESKSIASRGKSQETRQSHTMRPGAGSEEMTQEFDKLLNELQIPQTLRPKLNGMDANVKAAMLRSSHMVKTVPKHGVLSPKKDQHQLRRTKSIDSATSQTIGQDVAAFEPPKPGQIAGHFMGAAARSSFDLTRSSDDEASTMHQSVHRSRGLSLDINKHSSKAGSKADATSSKANGQKSKETNASKYVNALTSISSLELDIEIVKKLRLLLRNETASWTDSFVQLGGYSALLTRLNEILEVEWREEQHDDKLLHELLRCFKALSTSEIGCAALRSAGAAPFGQLIRLLYSDKKPGDVSTRQLMIELIYSLFELYPPSSLPCASPTSPMDRREVWQDAMDYEGHSFVRNSQLIYLPAPHRNLFTFIRSLLLTKAPEPAEQSTNPISPHEFIEVLHVPRIYKTYLQELSDICRDYFWVFCHSSNTIWNLDDTDEKRVEKPRAPGGMTGGVEFEAMSYLTMHFKFINSIAECAMKLKFPKEHELSAHCFHSDLFASGFERILLVARKASTTYYPTLHLEIARYISLAMQANYELPWTISRTIGPPPAAMAKAGRLAKERDRARHSTASASRGQRSVPAASAPGTPSRDRNSAHYLPPLPPQGKIEPLRF